MIDLKKNSRVSKQKHLFSVIALPIAYISVFFLFILKIVKDFQSNDFI